MSRCMPEVYGADMRVLILIIAVTGLTSFGAERAARPAKEPAYVDPFIFLKDYRIQHYLESATELQKLKPTQRAKRLKALAVDPKRASEVYPLCRMLFEAKPKGEFRRPMLGSPSFVDGGDLADWPLEPITLFEGLPILVVAGYSLAGQAELSESYVDYCLEDCKWRDHKYEPLPAQKRKEIVEKFIAANPKMKRDADWLRRQAE
jgi:hypothetical protein